MLDSVSRAIEHLDVFSFCNKSINPCTCNDFRLIPAKSHVSLQLHVNECAGVNFLEHVQVSIQNATFNFQRMFFTFWRMDFISIFHL